jgi:DNA-binding NtrC family response regulator
MIGQLLGRAKANWTGVDGKAEYCRRLLYLTDEKDSSRLLDELRHAGWEAEAVRSPCDALNRMKTEAYSVGLVHTGYVLGESNLRDWQRLYASSANMQWIGLCSSDPQDDPELRHAIRKYLFDYHMLPIDSERLSVILGHAHGMAKLKLPQGAPATELEQPAGIVYSSATMARLLARASKAARADAPVLILGESGTGKELVAHAVHAASGRASAPFVVVNCGAMSDTLVHSELFGYERGAFTGADRRKIGRIELAQGGTIFLDEIGDLRPDLQTNLLRFLQEGTIDRLGGHDSIAVDAHVIAATHVDLAKAVREGRFREDLYFRLNVIQLDMPALRERGSDIGILARFFFERFVHDGNPDLRGFSEAAMDVLYQHAWPGNVRELMNCVRHAVIMAENRLIEPDDLRLPRGKAGAPQSLAEARASAERSAIASALQASRHNMSDAAARLAISRATLYRLVERYWLG